MRETQTYFIYPLMFHSRVERELSEFSSRLIPVPQGEFGDIVYDMSSKFAMPYLGNVLTMMLLPIATNLSKKVYLWGFDGRAPGDKLFWSNSKQHSYPELLPELVLTHPAFFAYHVPDKNPTKYVKEVHGDVLEKLLIGAESKGYRFVMMHPSYTPSLQKRFRHQVGSRI